jgi:uncharacterized protein YjgD (DUF1641 family)
VLNALQNLSVLCMALSRVPPEQFYRIVFALKDGMEGLIAAAGRSQASSHPPGLTGAYRMLQDEHLWGALAPLGEALKAFAAGIERPVENPISAFSGKSGRTS